MKFDWRWGVIRAPARKWQASLLPASQWAQLRHVTRPAAREAGSAHCVLERRARQVCEPPCLLAVTAFAVCSPPQRGPADNLPVLQDQTLYHPVSGSCMDCSERDHRIFMNTCNPSSPTQQWLFEHTNSTVLEKFNSN